MKTPTKTISNKQYKAFIKWLNKAIKYDLESIKQVHNPTTASFYRGHSEGLIYAKGWAKTFLEDMKDENTDKRAD